MSSIEFDLRASSRDFSAPTYQFTGDEDYSSADYQYAILCGYLSSVSTLCGAADGCGLKVDAETFERWKRGSAAAGLIDDFLDNSDDIVRANQFYQAGILTKNKTGLSELARLGGASKRLSRSIGLLDNSVEILPVEQAQRSATAASAIGNIAVDKSQCTDVDSYTDMLKEEGVHTKDLVVSLISDDVRVQPGFEMFDNWCEQALIVATLADGARDLWSDRAAGRTGVEATAINSLKIVSAARISLRKLNQSSQLRRASIAGITARLTFSKIPTKLTMSRY